ncbi:hypothetical protein L226DRAFT_520587 [Lentinus tigrinus ALCF2SS1-7]|uniref:uncharacterized protein n=1 Tax=Lentinus tigrinus ALCF2SS1-7 TaxID=1328758 RepID=UPI001165E73C|nr:hypothetical protein L226DRAFT_520587 [Lentinus tigrinus ALCF2SS1-7]
MNLPMGSTLSPQELRRTAPQPQDFFAVVEDSNMDGEADTIETSWPPLQPSTSATGDRHSTCGLETPVSVTAQKQRAHLTVTLMHRMDGIEQSLGTQARVQSDLLDGVNELKDKLGALALVAEHEDFTQELLAVSSDKEDHEVMDATPSRPSQSKLKATTSNRKASASTARPIVSPNGWSMPYIPPMSLDNEEVMVENMSTSQAANAEKTFINRLQDPVRSHMLWLLSCRELKEIGEKCPTLTNEELAEYEATKGNYFTRQNFHIDFKRGWVKCAYNCDARSFFCHHFLESMAGGSYRSPPIPSWFFTMDQVGGTLDSHMDHAHAVWRQHANPPSAAQIAACVRQKQINSHWKMLYVQRSWVIAIYALEEYYLLFSKLVVIHLSGDEADGPEGWLTLKYIIIEAAWQSKLIKTFFRTLDWRYIEDWMNSLQNHGGRGPRTCITKDGAEVVDSEAPVGLWHNCNSNDWLATKLSCKGCAALEEAKEVHDAMLKAAGIDDIE